MTEIYLTEALPAHKRTACFACGNAFKERFICFFVDHDMRMPICRQCAVDHGFVIEGPPGEIRFYCQRNKETGFIEIAEYDEKHDATFSIEKTL
jgi:hypothetical protein